MRESLRAHHAITMLRPDFPVMPISHLPDHLFANVLRHCDEPTRDIAVRASRRVAELTVFARRLDYRHAATRPGRGSLAPLPMLCELADRGCPRPNYGAVAATFDDDRGAAGADDPLASFFAKMSKLVAIITNSQQARANDLFSLMVPGSPCVVGQWTLGHDHYRGSRRRSDLGYHGFGWLRNSFSQYAGDFRDGRRSGYGQLSLSDGSCYEGYFEDDHYAGHGTLRYPNGDRYTGCFAWGRPHGQGTLTEAGGLRTEGSFRDGTREGPGVTTASWGVTYRGLFAEGKHHGLGSYTAADGFHYEGSFFHDERHGFGEAHWPRGDTYRGTWHDGLPHGEGQWRMADGSLYIGTHTHGARTGWGTLTRSDGTMHVGNFVAGAAERGGTEYRPDGGRRSGIWRAGELVVSSDPVP